MLKLFMALLFSLLAGIPMVLLLKALGVDTYLRGYYTGIVVTLAAQFGMVVADGIKKFSDMNK